MGTRRPLSSCARTEARDRHQAFVQRANGQSQRGGQSSQAPAARTRRLAQAPRHRLVEESLGALDFTLAPELVACLDVASEPARPFPYYVFADGRQARIQGEANVRAVPVNHPSAACSGSDDAILTEEQAASIRRALYPIIYVSADINSPQNADI